MKWSMLWVLSVHNMSLAFDHTCSLGKSELETCLHFPVSENSDRKLRSASSFLFLVVPIVQFDVVHQHLDLRHKQHTNSCRQHVLNLHVLVSLCSLDSPLTLGISASKASSSSSFPISDICTTFPIRSVSSPRCAASRFSVFVGLTSALLCHPRFPTAEISSQDNDQHRSHCWSLLISMVETHEAGQSMAHKVQQGTVRSCA